MENFRARASGHAHRGQGGPERGRFIFRRNFSPVYEGGDTLSIKPQRRGKERARARGECRAGDSLRSIVSALLPPRLRVERRRSFIKRASGINQPLLSPRVPLADFLKFTTPGSSTRSPNQPLSTGELPYPFYVHKFRRPVYACGTANATTGASKV